MEPISKGVDIEIMEGIKGTKPLSGVYERFNVALTDPLSVEEAFQSEELRKTIDLEMKMIEKSGTWNLKAKEEEDNRSQVDF